MPKPPSPKQINFIKNLVKKADLEEAGACNLVNVTNYSELSGGRQGTASKLIETLLDKRTFSSKVLYSSSNQICLENTLFYPEGGGQVGDKGDIETQNGQLHYITDTKKENNLIIHFSKTIPSRTEEKFKVFVKILFMLISLK